MASEEAADAMPSEAQEEEQKTEQTGEEQEANTGEPLAQTEEPIADDGQEEAAAAGNEPAVEAPAVEYAPEDLPVAMETPAAEAVTVAPEPASAEPTQNEAVQPEPSGEQEPEPAAEIVQVAEPEPEPAAEVVQVTEPAAEVVQVAEPAAELEPQAAIATEPEPTAEVFTAAETEPAAVNESDSVPAAIPDAPPMMHRASSRNASGEKLAPTALSQVWSFGMNRHVPVINITDTTRRMIFYACAHTGILYDFHGNQQLLLQGHANNISCTCVSADKRWVATADLGSDNMVVVWDSYTGVPVRNIFDPHPEGIVAMAMTPDAKYLVTISTGQNQILSIWDWTVEGDALCSVELQPSYGVQSYVLFNPNNTSQLVSNSDGQVVFYSWQGNSIKHFAPPLSDDDFNKPVGRFSQSIFLENCKRVLTGTSLGNLVVWDMKKGTTEVSDKKATKLVRMQERAINVITTTERFIVIGDVLGHVKFFDQSLKLLNWYQDFHLGPINSLSFAYSSDFNEINGGSCDYPPDATIKARPFAIRDFVIGTSTAVYGHVHTDGTDVTVIHKDHDGPVHALSPHPTEPRFAVGSYSGHLQIWNYDKKKVLVSRTFERGNMIRCCEFNPTGRMIGVGFTNGSIRVVDAITLHDMLEEPIRYARDAITHIAFSHDSQFVATADAENTVSLLKKGDTEEPFEYVGRYKAHYKPIQDLTFGIQLDSNVPRLLSLGQDRVLVEYDLQNSSRDDIRLLTSDRIEQSAVPFCMAWYPPVNKESFIITANDQFKLKLYNSTTKMCRKTLLGPAFGSPVQKIAILPNNSDDASAKRYMAFVTTDKVGLHSLPLDGNPHNAVAFISHPLGVGNLCCSYDGKYLLTAGGSDATVLMWAINPAALEAQAKLGGEDLVPFYGLLDGGREGDLYKELEDYFYYAQIRSQGVDTMETRKVASSIPVTEIPYVMRAMGFYPSEQEIEDMLNEIKFSDYVETGKYKTSVDMGEFIQLYINHRPAFGLQPDKLAWAFETLGVTMDGLPFLDRSELLHLLQNRGEHITEYQLAEYLTTLLGFNAEGGSSELQDFDTEKAGQLIDENLPYEITADMFANELLGFGMYSSDVLQVEGESQSPPSAQVN